MKTTNPNWNMKKLQKMASKGELRFDYPIQRASGQWDDLQQSLLIHSIVDGYPIPPIAVAKAEVGGQEGEYIIDGKQRTTTVLNFISGVKDKQTGEYPSTAYRLHVETPSLEVEGEEPLVLAGKYFDEIHEDLQADILSSSFMIQRMENATDEEVEEIFNRWNNGTPLTKQQKARGKMGTANATIIANLLNHPFIQMVAQFTPLQRKRSDDEAVILQSMMLLDENYNFESFVSDKILKFASDMRDADITGITDQLKKSLDYALESGATSPLFKKLHLPTLLMVAKKAVEDKVDPKVFSAWVEDFNFAINMRTRDKATVKTNYKIYTGAGSVKRDKVMGRKNEMLTHFTKFVNSYKPPVEQKEEVKEVAKETKKEEPKKQVEEPKKEVKAPAKEVKAPTKDEMKVVNKELDKALQKA